MKQVEHDYIKLSRKILKWEWWDDFNTSRLFIYMLLVANWKEGNFRGKTVPRGSFVSSIGKLSECTGLTQDEVRTAIKHLTKTGEITKRSTNKYTVYTVKNFESYQGSPKQEAEQHPSNSQAIPKLFPTIEEYKEIYNDDDVIYARELLAKFWGTPITDFDVQTALEKMQSFDGERLSLDERKAGLLRYALVNSAYTGQRNWKYVSGILKRLKDRGIDTVEQAEEYDAERDMEKL